MTDVGVLCQGEWSRDLLDTVEDRFLSPSEGQVFGGKEMQGRDGYSCTPLLLSPGTAGSLVSSLHALLAPRAASGHFAWQAGTCLPYPSPKGTMPAGPWIWGTL